MKKCGLQMIVFILMSVITIYIVSNFSQNDKGYLYANIEALAQVEHGKYIKCYETITSDPSDTVVYCGVCSEIPGRWVSGMSFCIPN